MQQQQSSMSFPCLLVALLLTTAGVSAVEPEMSLLSASNLSVLPLPERTAAAALRMCMEHSAGSQFCAWLHVDSRTELVSGGVCFDETRASCNRMGYKGSKNRQLYRYFTCDDCSPCAGQRAACAAPNCSLLCYCSCGHALRPSQPGSGVQMDPTGADWHFVYPCQKLCDGQQHCPYGEDEHDHVCTHLRAGASNWSAKQFLDNTKTVEFKMFVVIGVLMFGLGIFSVLNTKFRCVPWMLRNPVPRRSLAAGALLQSEQQQQQQQQQLQQQQQQQQLQQQQHAVSI